MCPALSQNCSYITHKELYSLCVVEDVNFQNVIKKQVIQVVSGKKRKYVLPRTTLKLAE